MKLRPIPKATRDRLANEPFMQEYCIHARRAASSPCAGESTWEHPFGRRGDFVGVVVKCCKKHNVGVSGEEKAFNKLRAIEIYGLEKFKEISPKLNWEQELRRLKYLTSEK